MLRLVSMTPLGKPVVPDVYCMLITSVTPMDRPRASSASSGTRAGASRSDADGHQTARDRARLALEGIKCVTRTTCVHERFVLRQRTRQVRQEVADGAITKWWLAHRWRIVPQ